MLVVGCIAGLGLPGLAGFWGEFLAVYGAWQADPVATGAPVAFWRALAALAVLGTLLAAAYLLRVLRLLWHGETVDRAAGTDASSTEVAVGLPLVVLSVVPGLLPWLLLATTEPAVRQLLAVDRGFV
jgi:NADH-quinone oxidoreductase subunit M